MSLEGMMAKRIIAACEFLTQIKIPGLSLKRPRVNSRKNVMGTLQPWSVSTIKPILLENKLYIIGGWLGAGPLAADDLHILELDSFKWLPHQTSGE